jgi:hypothetical protein
MLFLMLSASTPFSFSLKVS